MEVLNELSKNYNIIKKIGNGSFGQVYKGISKNDNELVAIKIENNSSISRLELEMKLYNELSRDKGVPNIKWFGKISQNPILIMDYLGPNLDDLFDFCKRKFTLKTVLMIALQILNRIEFVHNNNIIHRDIKPDNFLIGTAKNKNIIYIIDFGLSKKFCQNKDNHIEYKKGRNFTGSFRYSSIRNHKGIEQSRRDDLESIGYMLIYFLKGNLPWQGLKGSTKSKRSKNIFNIKRNTSLEELCENIPEEFFLYMKYCRLLRFKENPNYNYLKNLFIDLSKKKNIILDDIYDWNLVAKEKKKIRMNEILKNNENRNSKAENSDIVEKKRNNANTNDEK